METKVCTACGIKKSVAEFNLHHAHVKAGSSKYRGLCKICERQWKHEFYQKPENKEKRKLYNKRAFERVKAWKKRPDVKKKALEYAKEYARKYPERILNSYWKRNFGITFNDYQKMFSAQNGRCAICGSEKPNGGRRMKRFAVDHIGKKVRGLLCFKCNSALGLFGESIEILQKAINYLRGS